jgi:hypothetical protein
VRTSDEGTQIVQIEPANNLPRAVHFPPGIMRATSSWVRKDRTASTPIEEAFFVTPVGDESYVSIFNPRDLQRGANQRQRKVAARPLDWQPDRIGQYVLLRYRLVGDRLDMWLATHEAVDQAIQSGKVGGHVRRESDFTKRTVPGAEDKIITAHLTDSTPNLFRFLESGGGDLLYSGEPDYVYTRLRQLAER